MRYRFGNKIVKIPGAYSQIKSGLEISPVTQDYGTVLIIDLGMGENSSVGSGINGENEQGKNSIATITNFLDGEAFFRDGQLYSIMQPCFRPSPNFAESGCSQIKVVRAATTTAAEIDITLTGDGGDAGTVKIKTIGEGTAVNGVESNNKLTKGFKAEFIELDSGGYIMNIYRGTFRGINPQAIPYNLPESESEPELIYQTGTFTTVSELKDLIEEDREFSEFFILGDVTVDQDTISDFGGEEFLFSGGSATYGQSDLDDALDTIKDLNVRFILTTDFFTDAESANNAKIITYIEQENKFKPELYVGGGEGKSSFMTSSDSSKSAVEFFNSQNVTVVHGRPVVRSEASANKQRIESSFYKAALIMGREAGLEPQIPTTYKNVNILSDKHELSETDIEAGIGAGILMTKEHEGRHEVVFGINSLQNNNNLMNQDSTTPNKQLRRIVRQVNAELIVNLKNDLLKNPVGTNRHTLSPVDYERYIDNYLRNITANTTQDNLILRHQNVQVQVDGLAYRASYEIVPNFEVAFLFSTGFVIDPQN